MNSNQFKDFNFYLSLGYVIVIASVLTIIIMQIYKLILKKKKVITSEIDPNKKDSILTNAGRVIALIVYAVIYFLNEFYLKHKIEFDEALLVGLLSGGTATLTIAKGLYTSIRQHQKKASVYDKLKVAEDKIIQLQKEEPRKITLTSIMEDK